MAKAEVQECDQSEIARVENWRLGELIRAGYPPGEAETLARADYVDLHEAVALVTEKSCSPATATQILL